MSGSAAMKLPIQGLLVAGEFTAVLAGYAHPILHHVRPQGAANDGQEVLVTDPARDPEHQDIVIDPVETFLQLLTRRQCHCALLVAVRVVLRSSLR
jgi:hypothetical protein